MNPWLFLVFTCLIVTGFAGIWTIFDQNTSENTVDSHNHSTWMIIRPPYDVQAMVLDEPDRIWIGGEEGVFFMNKTTHTLLPLPSCLSEIVYVKDLMIDHEKTLWIGTNNGLFRYENESCHYYSTENGLPDNTVLCLMTDHNGRVHAGTMNGTVIFENGIISGYQQGMQNLIVFVVKEDQFGGIWYGSYASQGGGVSILTNGTWQHFGVKDGLPHKAVTSMLSARDGAFWVGTGVFDRGGAARFTWNGTGWSIVEVFTRESGLAGEKVRSLYQDNENAIWFGSEMNGVAVYQNRSFVVYTNEDGLSDNEVLDFVEYSNSELWLGTKNGITIIKKNISYSTE